MSTTNTIGSTGAWGYCPEHGTKLECQGDLRQQLVQETGLTDNGDGSKLQKQAECEDCVQAEFDRERCTFCHQFDHMECQYICSTCPKKICAV